VFPGAIDPHVHFDEPGFTHREDFLHGTMAAARGGVTTVIDMPCTSLPPVTTAANLREKLAAMGGRGVVDYALYGGVSGHRIEEALASDMEALAPDVVGFKCYFVSGMDTFTAVDHYGFGGAVAKAAGLGRPLLLHAEDPGVVLPATAAMKARSVVGRLRRFAARVRRDRRGRLGYRPGERPRRRPSRRPCRYRRRSRGRSRGRRYLRDLPALPRIRPRGLRGQGIVAEDRAAG
jgi:hypothetical protein